MDQMTATALLLPLPPQSFHVDHLFLYLIPAAVVASISLSFRTVALSSQSSYIFESTAAIFHTCFQTRRTLSKGPVLAGANQNRQ